MVSLQKIRCECSTTWLILKFKCTWSSWSTFLQGEFYRQTWHPNLPSATPCHLFWHRDSLNVFEKLLCLVFHNLSKIILEYLKILLRGNIVAETMPRPAAPVRDSEVSLLIDYEIKRFLPKKMTSKFCSGTKCCWSVQTRKHVPGNIGFTSFLGSIKTSYNKPWRYGGEKIERNLKHNKSLQTFYTWKWYHMKWLLKT